MKDLCDLEEKLLKELLEQDDVERDEDLIMRLVGYGCNGTSAPRRPPDPAEFC